MTTEWLDLADTLHLNGVELPDEEIEDEDEDEDEDEPSCAPAGVASAAQVIAHDLSAAVEPVSTHVKSSFEAVPALLWSASATTFTPTPPTPPTPPPGTIAVGGKQVTAATLKAAVVSLVYHKSHLAGLVLRNAGNTLGYADLDAVANAEHKLFPDVEGGQGQKKRLLISAFQRAYLELTGEPALAEHILPPVPVHGNGTVVFDEHGYAVNHHRGLNLLDDFEDDYTEAVRAIAARFGGDIVGTHAVVTHHDAFEWVEAWTRGRLETCYQLEAKHVVPHPQHPGGPANPHTHHVVWQPEVPGEVPAGVRIPGNWPSPSTTWGDYNTIAYLVAAKMANPAGLSMSARRSWVSNHIQGDKRATDYWSVDARRRVATSPAGYLHAVPVGAAGTPTGGLSSDPHEWTTQDPTSWPLGALDAYAAQHQLELPDRWDYRLLVDAVTARRIGEQVDEVRAGIAAPRVFTTAPDQGTFTGYHRKVLLVDQDGNRALFKPVAPDLAFRAEAEHHANVLARRFGYRTAASQLITHDGAYGQAQELLAVKGTLVGITTAGITALTTAQLTAIAREHLLDWALDNDDCHGANIVELDNGDIVGIDKGRAFRYFGGWPGLSGDTRANTNCALIYTTLYRAIAAHLIDRATVDAVYRAVYARALRMRAVPDTVVADHVRDAVANRPHFRPSTYQRTVPDAPTNPDELVAAVLARKNNLVADMTALWRRVYAAAHWDAPELSWMLGENPDGARLYAGLTDPDLLGAVAVTKSFGTPAFVAGRDVEDAHILLWRERRHDGVWLLRGEFKFTGDAVQRATAWCDRHNVVDNSRFDSTLSDCLYEDLCRAVGYVNSAASGNPFATWRDASYVVEKCSSVIGVARMQIARGVNNTGMFDHYAEMVTVLQAAVAARGGVPADLVTRYTAPPTPPDPDGTTPLVHTEPCSRPLASRNDVPCFAENGELHLIEDVVTGDLQQGNAYMIDLPTGETLEYRSPKHTNLSAAGMLRFTATWDDPTVSLSRIAEQIEKMGTPLRPATHHDLELFYWRHLYAIMSGRADGRTPTGAYKAVHIRQTLVRVCQLRGPAAEIDAWRRAFAPLTSRDQIDAFTAAGRHLPRLLHLDLRRPDQHCGRPHWDRFDIPDNVWRTKEMPVVHFNNGVRHVLATGAAYSTEARIRTLGIWKAGMSSSADQQHGSADFVFLRANREGSQERNYCLLFSPRVLARTSTYTFPSDGYGRLEYRRTRAHYDFERATGHTHGNNEVMVKHALSLLDDVEILAVSGEDQRVEVIARLAELGITHLRGVPVSVRVVTRHAYLRRTALAAALREVIPG